MILQRINNIVFFVLVPGKYVIEGKIQITEPMLNFHTLTADDLVDKNSEVYRFLEDICRDIVSIKWYSFVNNS